MFRNSCWSRWEYISTLWLLSVMFRALHILWAIIKHKQAFVGGAVDMGVESWVAGEGRIVVEGVLIVGQLVGHICQSDLAMCCVSNGANFQVSSNSVHWPKANKKKKKTIEVYMYIQLRELSCKPERRSKFQHLYLRLLWAKIYCAAQSENCKTISAKAQIKYEKKNKEKRIKATKLQFK